MTLYDFLNLSKKDRNKYVKEHGLTSYTNFPKDYGAFKQKFDITNDDDIKVTYYNCITRYGVTEWYLYFTFGDITVKFEFCVYGKGNIQLVKIRDILFYSKECDLFDSRSPYNRIEYCIYDDLKTFFSEIFDKSENLLEYVYHYYINTKSFIYMVEPYFYNGGYEISYNKYTDKPFERGKMYMCTGGISFASAVNFLKNTTNYYRLDFSFDDTMALYRYVYKLDDRNNPIVKNVCDLYSNIYKNVNNLDRDYFIDLLNTAKKSIDNTVEDGRLSWYQTITDIKKEIYHKCLNVISEVANEYDLDKELFSFSCGYSPKYPKDTIIPNMPEKYKDKFRD